MNRRLPVQRSLAILLFFALLSVIAMAPLSLYLGSRVPAIAPETRVGLDYYHFHWNLWWLRHAFLNGESIWYTNMALAPFTHNLTYHSLSASMLPFYLVLEPLIGHLRAANGLILLHLTLSGLLMYAFLRWKGVRRDVALWGGTAYAFTPYMLDHAAASHLNLITAWWLPLVLFTWEKTDRTCRFRWAIATGLVLWGMWFTDTLIAFWGGLLLGPYAIYALLKAPDNRTRSRLVMLGAVALALAVALAWIIGPLRQTLDFDTSQLRPARLLTLRHYALPLQALILPEPGGVQQTGFESDETMGIVLVVLSYAAVIAALRRRCRDREACFWLLAALPALILTLGPDVTVFDVRVPMPFRIIHALFNGQMRTPLRFLPPATAGLVVFLDLTFERWLQPRSRLARQWIVALGLLALLADYGVFVPVASGPALRPYDFHWMMRAEHYDDYDYVVLDVPSGPFSGWREVGTHPEAMVYGITHEKRQVSGLLSRVPIEQHLFFEQNPLLGWLTGSRPLDASAAASDLIKFVDTWPIGYVVVHLNWLTPERTQETLAFFNSNPAVCFVTAERDAVLYRTRSHPKGCPPRTPPTTAPGEFTLLMGEPTPQADMPDAGFVGHGWYPPENIGGEMARWAGDGDEALLYAALPPDGAYTMTFRAVAFHEPRQITIVAGNLVEGEPHVEHLGTVTVAPGGWQTYTVPIPAELVQTVGGDLVFSLTADGMRSAAEVGLSDDTRPLTVAYDWFRFTAAPDAP